MCEKLDPNTATCADNPGERCVQVPLNKCHYKALPRSAQWLYQRKAPEVKAST